MTKRFAALAIILCSAACGLTVVGTDVPASDAGASASSSSGSGSSTSSSSGTVVTTPDGSAPDAAPDASNPLDAGGGVTCAGVTGAIACFDFDTPPSSTAPNFGFSSWLGFGGGTRSLEPSQLADAGNALAVIENNAPAGDHSFYGAFPINESNATLVLDADVALISLSMKKAGVIGFHVSGAGASMCDHLIGVGFDTGSAEFLNDADENQITTPLTLGSSIHVHVEAAINFGSTASASVTVAGQTQTYTKMYEANCKTLELWIGDWMTSMDANESIHVQFDQIIVTSK